MLAQKQRNADGAQIAPSVSPKRRKKRTSCSRRHCQMCQSLKQKGLIPWAWTWLRQNSNGKQRWRDWTLNIIFTVFRLWIRFWIWQRGTISLWVWVWDTYLKSTKLLELSRNFCDDIVLKHDLPTDSLKNKWAKIFNLITVQILITIYAHNCIHVICSVNFVQLEHHFSKLSYIFDSMTTENHYSNHLRHIFTVCHDVGSVEVKTNCWLLIIFFRIVKTVMWCNMRFYLEVSLLQTSSMKIRV